MSIFTNIIDRLGIARKSEIKNLQRWQLDTADAQQWLMPDPYIFANQADMYRLDPLLGSVLDMFADDIGMTAFEVMRRKEEELVDIKNHDFEMLLENPNPLQTGAELVADTVLDYKVNGNATWWLSRKNYYDAPVEIWYIPFNQIKPIPDGRLYLAGYKYYPGNGKEPIMLPPWQIVHFRTRNPFNRFIGLSPIESLVDTLAGDIGMRKTQRQTYVQQNGEPPSILAFKDFIQDDAWAEIKAKVEESARDNKMLKLRGAGEAVTWMSRAMSNKEMDVVALFGENRKTIFDRLVPGALTMMESGANRSTADAARATYEDSLWRMMQIIAKKITKEILYVYTWGDKLVGQFEDPRTVDRQLEIAEIQEYSKYHTVNEVRTTKYKSDEISDERGKLFAVQINSATGDGTKKPENNTPPQLQAFTEQQNQQTLDNPQDPTQTQPPIDSSTKAAIDALYKWRKQIAGGRTEKAAAFTNSAIPQNMERAIKARLGGMSTEQAVRMIDGYIEGLKPKPQLNPLHILQGIEAGVKALELVKK